MTLPEIVSSTPALAIGAHTISSGDPMERGETDRSPSAPLSTAAYALAIVAFALHVGFSGRFGYFRDELYYAACGQHLAWGYVRALSARLSARDIVGIWHGSESADDLD